MVKRRCQVDYQVLNGSFTKVPGEVQITDDEEGRVYIEIPEEKRQICLGINLPVLLHALNEAVLSRQIPLRERRKRGH